MLFSGRLDLAATAHFWTDALAAASSEPSKPLVIDLAGVAACDTAGATLILAVERAHGPTSTITGATKAVGSVLAMVGQAAAMAPSAPIEAPPPWSVVVWSVLVAGVEAGVCGLAYLGEVVVACARLPARHRMFRFADVLRAADQAGVRAIPLIILLGILIGLILAY